MTRFFGTHIALEEQHVHCLRVPPPDLGRDGAHADWVRLALHTAEAPRLLDVSLDLRHDGPEPMPLVHDLPHFLEEIVRRGRAQRTTILARRVEDPLARDEEPIASQDARSFGDKRAVVSSLQRISDNCDGAQTGRLTASSRERAWTRSTDPLSKRVGSHRSCISNCTFEGGLLVAIGTESRDTEKAYKSQPSRKYQTARVSTHQCPVRISSHAGTRAPCPLP